MKDNQTYFRFLSGERISVIGTKLEGKLYSAIITIKESSSGPQYVSEIKIRGHIKSSVKRKIRPVFLELANKYLVKN